MAYKTKPRPLQSTIDYAMAVDAEQNGELRRMVSRGFFPNQRGEYTQMRSNTPAQIGAAGSPSPFVNEGFGIFFGNVLKGALLMIVPFIFILVGVLIGAGISHHMVAREAMEQIAGGVLLWTWGCKIIASVSDKFKESREKSNGENRLSAYVPWILVLATLFFWPVLHIALAHPNLKEFSQKLDFGINDVTDANTPHVCNTVFPPAKHDKFVRAGTTSQRACKELESQEASDELIPYMIGFALDGIVLLLLEWDGLVETELELTGKTVFFFLLKPLGLSIDNLLTGAALYDTLLRAHPNAWVGWMFLAACCVFFGFAAGVIIKLILNFVNSLLPNGGRKGYSPPLVDFVAYSIILGAGLSFLDAGLQLITNGFTFWVGVGGLVACALVVLENFLDEF